MAAASSSTPIKIIVGATFSAGFDITAKTPIDGRMTVQTLADLTDKRAWASKSGTDAAPEYWLYNGMSTTVAETGKLYVLTGIDESLPRTTWPNPAAPGTTATGPRWVEPGGVDNFLKDAYIVDAKYGYIAGQTSPAYYEKDDPNYNNVYSDIELTIPAEEKKYLKMVVEQSDHAGTVTHVIYCDVQDLIKNTGRPLKIYGNDDLCISFDGTLDRNLYLTGTENLVITVAPNHSINFGLEWQPIPVDPQA